MQARLEPAVDRREVFAEPLLRARAATGAATPGTALLTSKLQHRADEGLQVGQVEAGAQGEAKLSCKEDSKGLHVARMGLDGLHVVVWVL